MHTPYSGCLPPSIWAPCARVFPPIDPAPLTLDIVKQNMEGIALHSNFTYQREKVTRRMIRLGVLLGIATLLIGVLAACGAASASTELPTDPEAAAAFVLANANPDNGLAVIEKYACAACHVSVGQSDLAPSFAGLSAIAATRRPPLSAQAYVYEAIVAPQAHLVEGYFGTMPSYSTRMSTQELGDVIAFLLSPAVDTLYGES